MKLRPKALSLLLIFSILFSIAPARLAGASLDSPGAGGNVSQLSDLAAPPPNITADYAAVVDDNGQVLFGKDLHQLGAPASLTKIVTALVVLDKGDLSDVAKVSIDSKKFEAQTNGTVMGLMPGEEISLEALLYGLMLPSANDAAITIAEHIGGGSQDRFAQMMNDKVKSLGLANSNFSNPHGLDARGHVSTAYEMAMLGRYAMQNPTFAKIVGTKKITVQGKLRSYNLVSVNNLLSIYPGADGVKTGYTYAAKNAIVATAERNGRRVYISVIRSDNLWGDSQKLLDYFFSQPPTPTPTSAPSPTATPVPTNTPVPTPTSSPTPTSTPVLPVENDSGRSSTKQDSWLDALLNIPRQALRRAFPFRGDKLNVVQLRILRPPFETPPLEVLHFPPFLDNLVSAGIAIGGKASIRSEKCEENASHVVAGLREVHSTFTGVPR